MKIRNILIALITVLFLIPATRTYAIRDSVTTKRLGGNNRFETAVEISKEFVAKTNKKVNSVILCTAFEYADSVSVTPFAIYTNSPILLTKVNSLPIETKNRINEMNINKVYVIGGEGAISDNVANELKTMGVSTERIGGRNRFDTNRKILDKIPNERLGNNIHLVDGYDPYCGFALALDTINSKSTKDNIIINPLVLERNISSEETADILNYLKPKMKNKGIIDLYYQNNILITDYICPHGLDRTENHDYYTEHPATYATFLNNINFKDNYFRSIFSQNSIIITTDNDYADVMCVGPLSAITYTPIIYIPTAANNYEDLRVDSGFWDYLTDMYKDTQNVYYLGGKAVVKDNAENVLRNVNSIN